MLNTRPYNRALLQKPTFDINEFICFTRDIPFQKLNHHLHGHLDEVKKELGQLVNAEFEKFISLYSDIGDVGAEEIAALQLNLAQITQDTQILNNSLSSELETITNLMDEFNAITQDQVNLRQKREFCSNLKHLQVLMVEKNYELAALFLLRIKAQLATSPSLHSLSHLITKVNSITEDLIHNLEVQTRQALVMENVKECSNLIRVYLSLGKLTDFEQLFVEVIVKPYCDKVFRNEYLQELLLKEDETPALQQIFDQVLKFMDDIESNWIESLLRFVPESRPLRTNLLVVPVINGIQAGLPIIFSPGVPDAFQHAYVLSHEFLKQTLSAFETEHKAICSSEAWKSFLKIWQVGIYSQLRFRDIASDLEESLNSPFPLVDFNVKKVDIKRYPLAQFGVLKSSLESLWSDSVVIPPLFVKFFKLTLQTCARYIDWLASFPKEYESTELGLSALLLKTQSLHDTKSLLQYLLDQSIIPLFSSRNLDISCLKGSTEKFLNTKWSACENHLQATLLKSLCMVTAARSRTMLENYSDMSIFGAAGVLESLSGVLFNYYPTDYNFSDIFLQIARDFDEFAHPMLEIAVKAGNNVRRLQSLLQGEISEEDQLKLESESKLKRRIKAEIQTLIAESKAFGVADIGAGMPSFNELSSMSES